MILGIGEEETCSHARNVCQITPAYQDGRQLREDTASVARKHQNADSEFEFQAHFGSMNVSLSAGSARFTSAAPL